ncbi:universal stress protein family-domain-containing protein [Lipomyces arxii]|uniref:universal stress protein family-domain-containing protein n=1 Tax=Lipomyces arxii TaxID=56418 RepID=UPI0034CD455E
MSLEAALEEERLEILKLLNKDKNEERLTLPPSRMSRSASPGRSRRQSSSRDQPPPLVKSPVQGKITQSSLVKNFANLSPAAQELLLSSTSVPELIKKPPPTGPELQPYPTLSSHHRAPSLDGGALRPTKSAEDPPMSPLSPTSTRSQSRERLEFSNAYRRLSNAALLKAGGKLADLATKRSASMDARLEKDDEDAIESDSESSEESSEDEDDDDDLTRQRESRRPQSLLAAMEEERKIVSSSKYHVQSLIGPPPPSHIDGVMSYKRHLIHPKTAFDLIEDAKASFNSPYTSDNEEALDIQKAVNLPIVVSDIESSSDAGRVLRTITRGDYASIAAEDGIKKRSYIVATDSSAESQYALEWAIGTVLRDGNIMYAVYAIDESEDSASSTPAQTDSESSAVLEQDRINACKDITQQIVKLLRKTRLQVECVIEVMHSKSPKHLLCDVIDYLNPTMVILGSRGRSALKGVLLGSFSNYLVTKSSVPVMVARKRLKKSKHSSMPKFANNLRDGVTSLSFAKVD